MIRRLSSAFAADVPPGRRSRAARRAPLATLLLASLLPMLGTLGACAPEDSATPAPGERAALAAGLREREAPLVTTTRLETRRMDRVLETTTVVESEAQIDVVPRVSEVVVEVLAEEGDIVQAGEVLARLDETELVLSVRDAEVAASDARSALGLTKLAVKESERTVTQLQLAADKAERDYQRDQQLAADPKKQFISEKERDATKLARDRAVYDHWQGELAVERTKMEVEKAAIAVQRAELALERARVDLANADIRAPFPGVVARRDVRLGATASTSAAAFVLTDAEDLRATIYRPQRELLLFRGDGPLEISAKAEALPGWTFPGRILRTSPTIDAESGSFRVTASLGAAQRTLGEETAGDGAAPAPRLLPGMLVRLEIVTERRDDALTVRKKALRHEGNDAFLFVVDGGRVKRVRVDEGLEDDDLVEVLPLDGADLPPGTEVVLVGHRDLEDGAPVRIKLDAAQALSKAGVASEPGSETSGSKLTGTEE